MPPTGSSKNPLTKKVRFLAKNGLRIFSAVHWRIFKLSKHGERPWQTLQKTCKSLSRIFNRLADFCKKRKKNWKNRPSLPENPRLSNPTIFLKIAMKNRWVLNFYSPFMQKVSPETPSAWKSAKTKNEGFFEIFCKFFMFFALFSRISWIFFGDQNLSWN